MTAQAGDTLIPELAALKSAVRRAQRKKRVSIARGERRAGARNAARILVRHLGRGKRDIAIYISMRSELSTAPLRTLLIRAGHRVRVPVVLRGGLLSFATLDRLTPLRRTPRGLSQPVSLRGSCTASRLDVVVLPLLAFDGDGVRLGNGGGHYDRALAQSRGRAVRPERIGYAFAAQEVVGLPREDWDVPLDAVVTERGLRRFRGGRSV